MNLLKVLIITFIASLEVTATSSGTFEQLKRVGVEVFPESMKILTKDAFRRANHVANQVKCSAQNFSEVISSEFEKYVNYSCQQEAIKVVNEWNGQDEKKFCNELLTITYHDENNINPNGSCSPVEKLESDTDSFYRACQNYLENKNGITEKDRKKSYIKKHRKNLEEYAEVRKEFLEYRKSNFFLAPDIDKIFNCHANPGKALLGENSGLSIVQCENNRNLNSLSLEVLQQMEEEESRNENMKTPLVESLDELMTGWNMINKSESSSSNDYYAEEVRERSEIMTELLNFVGQNSSQKLENVSRKFTELTIDKVLNRNSNERLFLNYQGNRDVLKSVITLLSDEKSKPTKSKINKILEQIKDQRGNPIFSLSEAGQKKKDDFLNDVKSFITPVKNFKKEYQQILSIHKFLNGYTLHDSEWPDFVEKNINVFYGKDVFDPRDVKKYIQNEICSRMDKDDCSKVDMKDSYLFLSSIKMLQINDLYGRCDRIEKEAAQLCNDIENSKLNIDDKNVCLEKLISGELIRQVAVEFSTNQANFKQSNTFYRANQAACNLIMEQETSPNENFNYECRRSGQKVSTCRKALIDNIELMIKGIKIKPEYNDERGTPINFIEPTDLNSNHLQATAEGRDIANAMAGYERDNDAGNGGCSLGGMFCSVEKSSSRSESKALEHSFGGHATGISSSSTGGNINPLASTTSIDEVSNQSDTMANMNSVNTGTPFAGAVAQAQVEQAQLIETMVASKPEVISSEERINALEERLAELNNKGNEEVDADGVEDSEDSKNTFLEDRMKREREFSEIEKLKAELALEQKKARELREQLRKEIEQELGVAQVDHSESNHSPSDFGAAVVGSPRSTRTVAEDGINNNSGIGVGVGTFSPSSGSNSRGISSSSGGESGGSSGGGAYARGNSPKLVLNSRSPLVEGAVQSNDIVAVSTDQMGVIYDSISEAGIDNLGDGEEVYIRKDGEIIQIKNVDGTLVESIVEKIESDGPRFKKNDLSAPKNQKRKPIIRLDDITRETDKPGN